MASEELEFLRDEVQRLNDIVSRYQEKYPTLPKDRDGGAPDFPWRTDSNLMSPLLAQYDANLQLLSESADPATIRNLRQQMQQVAAENDRLRRDLKEAIQSQMEALPAESLAPRIGETDDDQVLENLQRQLQSSLQEKDAMEEMWKASALEVESLEANLQNARANPSLQQIEAQALQIKNQYMSTVQELNNEISSLQDELRLSKSELSMKNTQVKDLRSTLEELRIQLMQQEQEKSMVAGGKDKVDSYASNLARRMAETQSKLTRVEQDFESARKEQTRLEQQVLQLQKKSADHEQREYEATMQVRESVHMVESAIQEKDQAEQREKQALEDIEKLQGQLAKLVDEAGARTRQEVDNIKKQANVNLNRLMEEIHALEMENSEKQAQIDRAVREKRAVESELEKLYQEGMLKGTKDSGTYDELNRRACNAERTRDEALVKVDSIDSAMRRLEKNSKQEKAHLVAEMDQLKDRLAMMNSEFEGASDDRVKLTEKMDEMKKRMTSLQQERDAAVRTRTKEVTVLENEHQMRQQEYEARLQALEDGHRHAMMELRQMLASQQRMTAKKKKVPTATLR